MAWVPAWALARASSSLGLPSLTPRALAAASAFAANVLPIIAPMRAEGLSLEKIAAALNARGVATARGGKWAATQVRDILNRGGQRAELRRRPR